MIVYWPATLLCLFVFLFLLRKIPILKNEPLGLGFVFVATIFVLKVACGIAYGYFESKTGLGGDSLNYLEDAKWIFSAFHSHPLAYFQMLTGIHDNSQMIREDYYRFLITWKANDFDYFFNDNRTVVRLHALICLFSGGEYGVHVIIFTFLSFLGQIFLFKTFMKYIMIRPETLFMLICLAPSSMVWLSGIMKEPVVMFGIGLVIYNFDKILNKPFSRRGLAWLIAAMFLLLLMRFYILLCMLPGFVLFFWLTKRPGKVLLKSSIVVLGCILSAFSFDYFAADYKVSQIIYDQQMNYIKNEQYFNPGSHVDHADFQPSLHELLLNAPVAFVKTLLAPLHKITSNPYRFIFFIENILLFLLALFVIFHARKACKTALPLIVCCFFFIAILYVLIGLTIPFEGAIIRFRSVALPFVIFVMLSFLGPGNSISGHTLFKVRPL